MQEMHIVSIIPVIIDAIGIEPISSTRIEILPLNYTSYLLLRFY